MLDVEPDGVERQVVPVQLRVHLGHVPLVVIVPPALVVAQRKQLPPHRHRHNGQQGAQTKTYGSAQHRQHAHTQTTDIKHTRNRKKGYDTSLQKYKHRIQINRAYAKNKDKGKANKHKTENIYANLI